MQIISAIFANADMSLVKATMDDGSNHILPVTDARMDGVIVNPYVAPPTAVPSEITERQLYFALVNKNFISMEEALNIKANAVLPMKFKNALETAVQTGAMTATEAKFAELTLLTLRTASRSDPLWDVLIAVGAATNTQINEVFIAGAGY